MVNRPGWVAADRRVNPRDDLVTALVQAEVDGEQLDDLDLDPFFLVAAGNETTRNLITHSLLALIDLPDRAERLRREPDLWPTAVDEMLRRGGGGGAHFCLGANLAQAEITAVVRQLLDRLDGFELTGDVRRMRSDFVNGVKEMPVSFTPR